MVSVVKPPFIDEEHTCIWRKYCKEHDAITRQLTERLVMSRKHKHRLAEALIAIAKEAKLPESDPSVQMAARYLGRKRFKAIWREK